jgi:hypothetical protein
LFSVFPLMVDLDLDFFPIESLKYERLTYIISAKVDGLFSPSYPRLLPPSFLSINPVHKLPLHPFSSFPYFPKKKASHKREASARRDGLATG